MAIAKPILTLMLVLSLASPAMAARAGTTTANPASVVRAAAQQVVGALGKNAGKIKQDPQFAEQLVKKYLLPYFDFNLTSQLVLGLAWRTATPSQRKAFEAAFLHYLTRTYAKGISDFHGARVQVLPFRGSTSGRFATVRTRVTAAGHQPVSVDYVLYKTAGGWKIFDVKIAGVSYVQTYRDEFQSEIRRTSLAALIKRLQTARKPIVKPVPGGAGGR